MTVVVPLLMEVEFDLKPIFCSAITFWMILSKSVCANNSLGMDSCMISKRKKSACLFIAGIFEIKICTGKGVYPGSCIGVKGCGKGANICIPCNGTLLENRGTIFFLAAYLLSLSPVMQPVPSLYRGIFWRDSSVHLYLFSGCTTAVSGCCLTPHFRE